MHLQSRFDTCFNKDTTRLCFLAHQIEKSNILPHVRNSYLTGQLLDWFVSYLENRRQRVVISGVQSDWAYISAGVPQGSILGPLLFLLYINDIVNDIGCNIRLFADDTSLFVIVENPDSAAELINTDMGKISTGWKMVSQI